MIFKSRSPEDLKLLQDGVNHLGRTYPFSDIKHIFFHRMKTIQKHNWVKVGEPESAVLMLTMIGGDKLLLEIDESTIMIGWNTDRKLHIKKLSEIYIYLSRLTFTSRLAYYERDIKQQGYFVVGKCRFYPRDRITFRNKEFSLKTSNFFLNDFGGVEMRKKDFGWIDWLKNEFSFGGKPAFLILEDRDVLFYLLDRYFGLTLQ